MNREEQTPSVSLAEGFFNMATEGRSTRDVVPLIPTPAQVNGEVAAGAKSDPEFSNLKISSTESDSARKGPMIVDMDEEEEEGAGQAPEGDAQDLGNTGGRQRKGGALKENTNIYKSAFHIFKANVGTGVFMIPTFYKDSGYVMSVILTLAIGCVVVDCTQHLLKTKLIINRRDVTTYSQICHYVCGKAMGWFLFIALCLTQFGFCLMYSQLFSAAMDELVHFEKSKYVWVSVMFILGFAMTCFSDNLSLLSIASIVATFGVFYALISCFVASCMTLHTNGMHPTINPVGHNIPFGWFNNLANDMMVLEGIAVILPVHAACTQKHLLPRTITIVLVGVICAYIIFGITGYLAFGTTISKSVVTSMQNDAWGKSIRVLFAINIVFTYPLQFMSAMQLIDMLVGCKPRGGVGILLRGFINLVIAALSMALGADMVNIVVAFIGALPSTWMVIIIPSLLRLQVRYAVENPDVDRNTLSYWKSIFMGHGEGSWGFLRIRMIIYMILAVLIMVIGTYSIVQDDIINR